MSDLQSEIIGFSVVTVLVVFLAILTKITQNKYKNKD